MKYPTASSAYYSSLLTYILSAIYKLLTSKQFSIFADGACHTTVGDVSYNLLLVKKKIQITLSY